MDDFMFWVSLWFGVGIITGVIARVLDWRDGIDLRVEDIPVILFMTALWPFLTYVILADIFGGLGGRVLLRGKR